MRNVRTRLGRWGRPILARFHLGTDPSDGSSGSNSVMAVLARMGIDLVFDVGANNGSTGQWLRQSGYQGRIVSFEPQAQEFRALCESAGDDPLWECRRLALGAKDDMMPMHVSGFSPSSSLLPIGDKHIEVWPESRIIGTEEVHVARLDSLADEFDIASHATLLKIDVQGYESQVLGGAVRVLSQIAAVYAELLFAPLYEGQSAYHEVMATLDRAGLRFAGLYEIFRDPGTGLPLFANGLFIRHVEKPALERDKDRT